MKIDCIPDNGVYSSQIYITDELMLIFAKISGDYNKLHTDTTYAIERGFIDKVAYGNILGLLISHLIGMKLEINNVMLISQSINYKLPIYIRDIIDLNATVTIKSVAVQVVEFKLIFTNQHNEKVAFGKCRIKVL